MTPEQQKFYDALDKPEQELLDNLTSIKWRINNLYTIKDKDGNEIIMKLNYAQNKIAKKKHKREITLKSRQQGISTYKLIRALDMCIFKPGYEAGIQSYGKREAAKLATRAKLAWDRFPQVIKDFLGISVTKMNGEEVAFSNTSTLKIGNFRGDTLQSLHVSELGKIAKKYPDKAKELKTGAFQAVSVNNTISIESTAEGKSGLFYEMWQIAEKKLRAGIKLTKLDFNPIFLSWVEDPDCNLDEEVIIPPELIKYFDEVEKKLHKLDIFGAKVRKLRDTQKWWYVKKYEELGFEIKQEYPTFPEEAFEQSIEGTYYKTEYENLSIIADAYKPELLVNMAFDLGMSDTFTIGFFQCWEEETAKGIVKKTRIIGEYSNSGEALQHYKDVCDYLALERGWKFNETATPHDISVRELIAGKTRWQALLELGFNPVLVAKHLIPDGIQATREFLKDVEVDIECEEILAAIQNYRKKWDDKLEVYLNQPLHDKYSHHADMIRYMAMYLRNSWPQNHYIWELYNIEDEDDHYELQGAYDI